VASRTPQTLASPTDTPPSLRQDLAIPST